MADGSSDSESPSLLMDVSKHSDPSLVTSSSRECTNLMPKSKPKNIKDLRATPKVVLDCHRALTTVFGHKEYKGKQKEIVEAAKLGADVLVIAPTGMGKSLCFQIPAVADEHGITIVISPLLALMKNQVSKLRELDIRVVALTSETSATEKQQIVCDLQSGHPSYRLIYITPEKLCSKDFIELLQILYSHQGLNRLVVDEAHCISEWGHDFRTEYRRLGSFRDRFPDVPIMALTASATATVQDDIAASLGMSKTHLFKVVHPFNRPNLYYEVRYLPNPAPASQMEDIYAYITQLYKRRRRPSSGIIYCRTRATCDELAAYLRGKGLNARPYHRGIKPATLNRTLEEWQIGGAGDGGVDLVVATIAFGCGIDKSDVRYVIHYDLPKSLEAFYQETGRAGRDGSPSKCILYYSREDAIKVQKLVKMSHKDREAKALMSAGPAPTQRTVDSLDALIQFAETTSLCRHVSICRYFGELIDDKDKEVVTEYCLQMCDICKYPDKSQRRKAALSCEEFVSTQIPRLEKEAEPEDEEWPLPVLPQIDERSRAAPPARREECKRDGGYDSRQGPSEQYSSGSSKRSLDLKRSRLSLNDAGNAVKKPRIALPILGSGLLSSHLRQTFKTPFKTPFMSSAPPNPVKRQSLLPTPVEEDCVETPFEAEDVCVVLDDEEVEMVETAHVDAVRSSTPAAEIPDDEIEVDASFSQKIPVGLREDTLRAILKALYGVFMQGKGQDIMWKRLRMDVSARDNRHQVLRSTARELEFLVQSLCFTSEGYRSRGLAQVSAVKLVKNDKAWGDEEVGQEELEDAREVVTILRRTSSASRKGKQKAS